METLDKVSDTAQEAFERIADATSQTAEMLGEKGEQLLNAEERLMKSCRGYVRDNPMVSLGIAVAVGLMLSRLLKTS